MRAIVLIATLVATILVSGAASAGGTHNTTSHSTVTLVNEVTGTELSDMGVCFIDIDGVGVCREAILDGANDVDGTGDIIAGSVGEAEVDSSIAKATGADRVVSFTADTSTITPGPGGTACEKVGDRHLETDVATNNDCTCIDSAAETWLCSDSN